MSSQASKAAPNCSRVRTVPSWQAALAACSAVMDGVVTDATPAVVTTSLRGFSNSVHIASEFGMSTERDAFVTMLAKYTYL